MQTQVCFGGFMSKRRDTVSMYNPFPFVVKRSDRAVRTNHEIDEERKKAFKKIEPIEPKLSLMEQYLKSELGSLRDKWLKSNGWVRTVPRDYDVLASYRNKSTNHKIRIRKNHWIHEIYPDKTEVIHQSWEIFLIALKTRKECQGGKGNVE